MLGPLQKGPPKPPIPAPTKHLRGPDGAFSGCGGVGADPAAPVNGGVVDEDSHLSARVTLQWEIQRSSRCTLMKPLPRPWHPLGSRCWRCTVHDSIDRATGRLLGPIWRPFREGKGVCGTVLHPAMLTMLGERPSFSRLIADDTTGGENWQ